MRRLISFSIMLVLATASVCCAASKDLLVIVQDGRYGYIDHQGNVILPPQFIWAEDFWRGLGTVYVCGRYVSVDSAGNLHSLRIAIEGRVEPRKSGKHFGFADKSGEFRIPPQFDDALSFSEGLAAVKIGERWGFVNESGAIAIQPQYVSAFYFRDGVAIADTDTGFVLIDRSGKVIASGFDFSDLVSEQLVPASKEDQSGFLDVHGNIAIPFIYDSVKSFSEGLAAVESGGKWGYIDRQGRIVIPLKFDSADSFGNGLAAAKKAENAGSSTKRADFLFTCSSDTPPVFLKEQTIRICSSLRRMYRGSGPRTKNSAM